MHETIKITSDANGETFHLSEPYCFHTGEAYISRNAQTGEITLSPTDKSREIREKNWQKFLKLNAELVANGEIPDDFLTNLRDKSPPPERDFF